MRLLICAAVFASLVATAAAAADYVTRDDGIVCSSEQAVLEANRRQITEREDFLLLSCFLVGDGLEIDVIYVKSGTARIRLYTPDGRRMLLWLAVEDYEDAPPPGD